MHSHGLHVQLLQQHLRWLQMGFLVPHDEYTQFVYCCGQLDIVGHLWQMEYSY
jgi:hypothetical protein